MQWPTACKNSGKLFSLELSFSHKVFSLCWRVTVCLRFRFFVGSPILILLSSVKVSSYVDWSLLGNKAYTHVIGYFSSKTLMINSCWNGFGAVPKVPSMNQMSLSHKRLRPLKVANTMSLFELSSPSWKLSYIKNGMLSAPPVVIYSVGNSGMLLRESGSGGVFPHLIRLTARLIVGILPAATLTPTWYLASLSCTIWLGSPRFAATESFNSCLTFRAWTWKWSA